MSLWILRLTVKNLGQSTANSWYISIVISRTFFFMVNFFLRLIIEICQFFQPKANFFGRNVFNSDSRKLSFSREWSNYRGKNWYNTQSDEETAMTINGNCKHFQWSLHWGILGKKWSKQHKRKLKKLQDNLILSTKLIT